MKRRILLSVIYFLVQMPLLRAQCPNLDFSNCNFNGWECYTAKSGYYDSNWVFNCNGTYYDTLAWKLELAPISGRHTIIYDPYGTDNNTYCGTYNGLLLIPNGYRYSARIGNDNVGGEAESIRYRIAVDSTNFWVTVHYAAVLEFAQHWSEMESPRFGIRFQDTTGKPLPVGNLELSVKDTAQLIKCSGVYWKDWDVLAVNLSPWIGQTVELVIYAMDCGKAGHFGYGYAVCECGVKGNVRYCSNSSVAELSAPFGFSYYCWVDSAGKVLDTVQRIKIINPQIGTEYRCFMSNVQGSKDTISLRIRQTLISPSIMCQRDSLTPFIRLANRSVISGSRLANQIWHINRPGVGTEYISRDSVFDYCFKDTGMYEVILTVYAENGCSDTCFRRFMVAPVPTDVENVKLLSVRPDADSLEGGNLTFPRVVLCNTGRDSMKNIGLEVLVVDKYDTVVAHLRDTIAAIPGGDTAELAFRSRYTVPDYTGSYRLKAVYGTDTIVSVAHCIYRPDTCDISMLSVRPQQDSSFGIVKPVVRYTGYRNRYTYAVNHWDYVYVCLYDSNNVRLGMVNYNDYLNYKDTTVVMFSKGIKVFNYTGRYRLVAYVSYHASKNMIRSNDTVSCTGYCTGDTIDIRMLSVRPSKDSAFGETKVTPVLNTYYRHPDLVNSFVDVCVQMYDSSHVLLHQFKNEIFVNCNTTENKVMSYVDWKVPDYTGVYYLKAFFVNLKKEENLSTANDTAFFKAHCIRHLKKDVALLSVRPQHDSAEVGTWTSPVVVVKNVGDLDVRNVAVKVQVDTCTSSSYMGDMFAYYWDTIPFLAAGDSVKWVLSDRYQVKEVWTGSYYRMYASVAVDSDEVSANNNASYDANCYKSVDFRLISFHFPSDTLWGGVPVYPKVRIVNNSIVVTRYFEFWMEVYDSAGNMLQSWQESGSDHVNAGDTLDFQCTKSIQVPNYNGVFRLRAYLSYLPVEYTLLYRDTLVQYYRCFHNDTIDVALTDLIYPVTSEILLGRTKVYPKVFVRSRSNVVHDSLVITAIVYDNVGALYDSITDIIPKIEVGTSIYRFNRYYKVPNAPGKYTLKLCLESPKGDLSVADNVVQGEFRSRIRPDTVDVALDTLLCPSVTEVLPGNTEVRPQVRVVNRGNVEADSLVIDALVYDQSGTLTDSLSGMIVLLEEGADTLYTFPTAYLVPNVEGSYTLKLQVHAPYGDTCLANNVLQCQLRSRKNNAVDLQLLSVTLSDTGVLVGNAWVYPTVRVANPLRNADANDVKVYVEVQDSAGQRLGILRDELALVPLADTVELVFADTFQVPNYTGNFWVKAYVEVVLHEADRSNDTLLCAYFCQSSDAVSTVAIDSWQLGQNLPNPATGMTQVPVTLPESGRVMLQVHSAEGRLLYRGEHAVAEGKSLLLLDLAGYAAGVYYYSVEYRGERKVRKMVVE